MVNELRTRSRVVLVGNAAIRLCYKKPALKSAGLAEETRFEYAIEWFWWKRCYTVVL